MESERSGAASNGRLPVGSGDGAGDDLDDDLDGDEDENPDDDSDAGDEGATPAGRAESEELGDLPESLEEALLDAASELAGLTVRMAGVRHEFVAGGRVVATLDGEIAEFRLDPGVAAAALRTPGTSRSTSAPDRIAFAPAELDLYALDRAVAWLLSAARRAG